VYSNKQTIDFHNDISSSGAISQYQHKANNSFVMPPNCHHGPINMKEVSESVDLELTSLTAQVKSPKSQTMRSSNPGHRLYERGIQKD